jgi:hypothetical protein
LGRSVLDAQQGRLKHRRLTRLDLDTGPYAVGELYIVDAYQQLPLGPGPTNKVHGLAGLGIEECRPAPLEAWEGQDARLGRDNLDGHLAFLGGCGFDES